jgi:DNA-binding MarR family transcriptional regulator
MTFRYSDAILPFVQARYTLRPSQVWLLLALRRVGDDHQTVQSLADSAGVFRTIALGAAASLAAEGLVRRRRSPADGRRLVLTLTVPAKRLIDTQAYGDRLPDVEAVFRRLLASDLPNLTLRQLWVLFWLHERATDDAGPACISALAAGIMKVERTVVSRITAALSDPVPYVGCLIRRDTERGDKRAIPLSLTDEGRRWVESLLTDSPT